MIFQIENRGGLSQVSSSLRELRCSGRRDLRLIGKQTPQLKALLLRKKSGESHPCHFPCRLSSIAVKSL